MSAYLVRRLALSLFVLWGVLTLSYALTCLAPGDVVETLAGQRTDEAALARMRERLGMDKDPVTRYTLYLGNLLRGEWGESSRYREPVWPLLIHRLPRTAMLAAAALTFAVILGVLFGVLAAVFRGTWIDKGLSFLTLFGISAPVFWIGLLLIWVLSLQFRWLPPSGYEGGDIRYLILPALTLGLRSVALITRITRAALIDIDSSQFLRTARAKGLAPVVIYGKHALKNAALPILTVIGLDLGSYLSGSVLTEKVFGWPGVGMLTVDAIMARDTALINACVVFMAGIFVIVTPGDRSPLWSFRSESPERVMSEAVAVPGPREHLGRSWNLRRDWPVYALVLWIFAAMIVPEVWPDRYFETNYDAALEGPSLRHPMGTDPLGRDLFVRVWMGARISLAIAALSRVLALVLGTLLGGWAGYRGGWVDLVVMRIVDVMLAFPSLLARGRAGRALGTEFGLALRGDWDRELGRDCATNESSSPLGENERLCSGGQRFRMRTSPTLFQAHPSELFDPRPGLDHHRHGRGDSRRGGTILPRARSRTPSPPPGAL